MNQLAPPASRQSAKRTDRMRRGTRSKNRITIDMIGDPNEPGLYPLEAASRRLMISLMESGLECYEWDAASENRDTYTVTFLQSTRPSADFRRRSPNRCPCGSDEFDSKGNCLGCSGGVLGVCWHCRECFPADGGPCSRCGRNPDWEN